MTAWGVTCKLAENKDSKPANGFPLTLTGWLLKLPFHAAGTAPSLGFHGYSPSDLNIMLPRSLLSSGFTLNSTIICRLRMGHSRGTTEAYSFSLIA